MQIRSGDLLAWGHDSWKTFHDWEVQIVRMFTRSEYSHVGVAWVVGEQVLVIEAVVPAVRIVPLKDLLPCYWIAGETRNDWDERTEVTAMSKVGQPYSKWEAIKSVIVKVIPGANDKWQCAELAAFIRAPLLLEDYKSPTPTALVASALHSGAHLRYLTQLT